MTTIPYLEEELEKTTKQLNYYKNYSNRLLNDNKKKDNIINELEKLIDSYELGKYDYEIPVAILKDKLKELKEDKNE